MLFVCACYGGDAPSPPSEGPRATAPTLSPSAPRLRRLSPRELVNAYGDLLGERPSESELLPEAVPNGYDDGPRLARLETDKLARLERLAWRSADAAVARAEPRVFGTCGEPNACRDAIVSGLAPRAFRRPLTESERAHLVATYDEASIDGPPAAAAATLAAILLSPAFLYRSEIGASGPNGTELGSYEIASELSYFVTGHAPDDALLAAAARDELRSVEGRTREAERLLATPAGQEQLVTFLREWLAVRELPLVNKAGNLHRSPTELAIMGSDFDRTLDDVLARRPTLRELFTTRVAFPDVNLGLTYGVLGARGSRVELDDPHRRGVLTRAAFLTVHSATGHSAPITRGVFVLGALLCRVPKPPPAGIPRFPPLIEGPATTRERFAAHATDPKCSGCHRSIDGIGFGFESFDAVGRYREREEGKPVDDTGELVLEDGATEAFAGVAQLEERMLAHGELPRCFARQLYRFAMGTAEDEAAAKALDALAFGVDDSIRDLVVRLVASELFVKREAP